uniref:Uncharacterized protein n=1 Tax=Pyramimonas orientalis virus TaxID=455367 RepID=A0A7M3UP57_POV01|nr:hypothetical protein HWQ62_00387 [Pyramimonas orientalis virus]
MYQSNSKSILESFSINLNDKAKENKIDPVFGREKELSKLTGVLLKRTKNNPLLLGMPGVGKTALAEELARTIVNKTSHSDLYDKQVVLLDVVGLIAGTRERGVMEERVSDLIKELKERDDVILMIDEIHTLVGQNGSGVSETASLNIANMLKPGLARGDFRCIGATTLEEYSKYFVNDKAMERRFQPIYVNEPSLMDTVGILSHIKDKYEDFHNCEVTEDALTSCVNLAHRFLPYRNFPDKAIDLLDESCSRVNLEHHKKNRINKVVTSNDVEDVIKQFISTPLRIGDENDKIEILDTCLKNKILGQDRAIDTIVRTLKRHACGFYNTSRPIASMMFLGPTGTGKTETVNLLADYYFGCRERNIIRFDMSEYMEPHNVSTLIGTPPGYVGYGDGGKLTNAIKRNPYSIVLFDEIEKAHYKIYDSLLQILEDGILTDGMGNTYCFKNCIIIFTSNIGFTHKKQETLGFATDPAVECIYNIQNLHEELKYTFRPEFLNRIDMLLPFDYLDENTIKIIANDIIDDFIENISRTKNIKVIVTNETRSRVYDEGLDVNYGARPLRTTINKLIIDPICEQMLCELNESSDWFIV